jgi:hypothetical protein
MSSERSPMMNACHRCKHRRDVTGSAHSRCVHPDVPLLNVDAEEHGKRNGWFRWPSNFDPVWLTKCEGFAEGQPEPKKPTQPEVIDLAEVLKRSLQEL